MHTHQITLTKEENLVYQKILDFSRKALEQYIKSQEQKMREGYDRKSEQVTEKKLPEIAITYLDWLYSYLIQEWWQTTEEYDEAASFSTVVATEAGLFSSSSNQNHGITFSKHLALRTN